MLFYQYYLKRELHMLMLMMFLVSFCFTCKKLQPLCQGSSSIYSECQCFEDLLFFYFNMWSDYHASASQHAILWYFFCWFFPATIYDLGVGCNWWWTLGSPWYCSGRDCNSYQKIVNIYLLLFLLNCFLIFEFLLVFIEKVSDVS